MKISKRLTAVTEMVTAGSYAVDVGCDHGYTSITLVENGICPGAVASDVREGPLRAASANVARANLSGRIETVLADGIPKNPERYLPANVPAALIVTGMGGQLILRILSAAGKELLRFSELILGPQSEIPLVRKQLPELGFGIADERMVEEDGKFYFLIKAVRRPEIVGRPGENVRRQEIVDRPGENVRRPEIPGGEGEAVRRIEIFDSPGEAVRQDEIPDSLMEAEETGDEEILRRFTPLNDGSCHADDGKKEEEPFEELSLAFGRPLLLRKDPVLARFLDWRLGILCKIKENLTAGGQEQSERMAEVTEEKCLLEEALAFMRGASVRP